VPERLNKIHLKFSVLETEDQSQSYMEYYFVHSIETIRDNSVGWKTKCRAHGVPEWSDAQNTWERWCGTRIASDEEVTPPLNTWQACLGGVNPT